MYKYELKLQEVGMQVTDLSKGMQDKIKKFLKGVAAADKMRERLKGNITQATRESIEAELADMDIDAGDMKLVKGIEDGIKNKDKYDALAANLQKKRLEKGMSGSKPPAATPIPIPPATNPAPQPIPIPPATSPAPQPTPASVAPAPVAQVPTTPPASTPSPAPADKGKEEEVAKDGSSNVSGWAFAGIVVLSLLGLGAWAKKTGRI